MGMSITGASGCGCGGGVGTPGGLPQPGAPGGPPLPGSPGGPPAPPVGVADPEFVAKNWGARTPAAFAQMIWQDLNGPAAAAKYTHIAISDAWNKLSSSDKADVLPTLKAAAGLHLSLELDELHQTGLTDNAGQRRASGVFDVLEGAGLTGILPGNGGFTGTDGIFHPNTVDATRGLAEIRSRLEAVGMLVPKG